jgi:hypothetical protein
VLVERCRVGRRSDDIRALDSVDHILPKGEMIASAAQDGVREAHR